ncbi:hypothetical protein N9909_00195 [bacterium]|jgi:hypothetical protein|nr:hypothetical protein [bacterium]|tara:strand:- start:7401 stop:7814 length:414 start_codon:yes stop_codon:yes gene_type:complete
MSDAVADQALLDKLIKVYVKIRDKKVAISRELKEQEEELDVKLDKVKAALLAHCKETGLESGKTESGSFYRSVRSKYWTSDWESMNKFILEHEAVDLMEKRLHQGNMKQFLEENPDLHPPGLNTDREFTVTVRRSKK